MFNVFKNAMVKMPFDCMNNIKQSNLNIYDIRYICVSYKN